MGVATLVLCRFSSSWSHTSVCVTGLQPFTLVSVHSRHARHWSHHRISGVDCTAPQGPTNRRYGPIRPRVASPSGSCASPPTRPTPLHCLCGRPSSVLRPSQTLPLSPSKPPAAPHVFPCPHSFGPLRPLTRQTGPHIHSAEDLAQDGDLHLRPVIASQGRLPVVRRQSLGSETTCCAPAERCGTAQYFGQKREAEQSQNEKITCTLTRSNI